MLITTNWLALLAAGLTVLESVTAVPVEAQSGVFDILTYNIAGLPALLSGSDPKNNIPVIAQRISQYSIVQVQEDFAYNSLLYTPLSHPHRTPTSGNVPLGSGLNTLSHLPFVPSSLTRTTWSACWINVADCLTPKGFTSLRLTLSPTITLDLYNLHADAGQASLDFKARQKQFAQLAEYIATYSTPTGNPVIITGDMNALYSKEKDPMREFVAKTGVRDVWTVLKRGGVQPGVGETQECPFPWEDGMEEAECELIDKVFWRDGTGVRLVPTAWENENARFLTETGEPLSDHYPVRAEFRWETI
ncbi:Endonuclease/exonuclease/phosphatase [Ascodesmis nigricans]|uniref:Endonuclease/exonuclease/phosphatase n=1 Tax=Ascodesmis nigricans TaxID=341454 RepID=A0A4S2MS13_9PEZI|nr:Endonuclease/exonuclease/phosphatase [Ascodesmis nigricans]